MILLAGCIIYWLILPKALFNDPTCTVLEDRQGVLLGARIASDGQWRFPPADSIPEKYKACLLQFEDRFFYLHPGINPFSLGRALIQNIRAGKVVSGGSTLTMQVIRLSRKGKPRTLGQKLIEIILAPRLELEYKKSEILCLYASHAPFGGNVVGLEAAAWRYYGMSPWQLSWAESATLAVLPNSPALIYPGKQQFQLLGKRNRLLERLLHKGVIDTLTCTLAKEEPLPGRPFPLPNEAPHLLDRICLENQGARVQTTLDIWLQKHCSEIIERHHRVLKTNEIHNAAALVVEVETGHVVAYVGNTENPGKPELGSDVDIIRSPRSTGSILKPILFASMLDDGEILPGTLVPDIPTFLSGFAPKNFNNNYEGAVPARQALSKSLNIPAVRLLQQYGVERFYFLLRKAGLTTLSYPPGHYGLSLILGGAESTLWDLTGVYAGFSRILLHYNMTGKYFENDMHMPVLFTEAAENPPVQKILNEPSLLGAGSIWLTYQALLEVNRPEVEFGWKEFSSSGKIAWKTGTSFGFRDAWAIGTTPRYVVGVWVGNASGEGRPGLVGVNAASPIMFDIFRLLPKTNWFSIPYDELTRVTVCHQSGYRNGPWCDQVDTIFATLRGLETMPCPYHIMVHLDCTEKYRVHIGCVKENHIIHKNWFVLPPAMEWYYKSKNPSYRTLPPLLPGCEESDMLTPMELIYPKSSATVYIPVELDGTRGKVIFEAVHRQPDAIIYWHLDDRYIGHTRNIHQMGLSPAKGFHTLTLVDQEGTVLIRHFEVVDKE